MQTRVNLVGDLQAKACRWGMGAADNASTLLFCDVLRVG